MQYHYVVGYDSEYDRWFIESDTTAYFSDGSIWDDKAADETGYGWIVPDEGSEVEAIDYAALRMLESYIGNIPTPTGGN